MTDVGNHDLYGQPVLVAPQAFARLLYTNPVCLLTTTLGKRVVTGEDPEPEGFTGAPVNVMTISWLTATTNVAGGFVMSMNCSRHTAKLVEATGRFVLNVPVRGMEETVRRIGRSSGSDTDLSDVPSALDEKQPDEPGTERKWEGPAWRSKMERVGVRVCRPGWEPLPAEYYLPSSVLASVAATATDAPMMTAEARVATERDADSADAAAGPNPKRVCGAPTVGSDCMEAQAQPPLSRPRPKNKGAKGNALDALYNKFPELRIAKANSDEFGDIALADCIAHLVCRVAHTLKFPATDEASGGKLQATSSTSEIDREVGRLSTSPSLESSESEATQTKSRTDATTRQVKSAMEYFHSPGTPHHLTLFCFIELAFVREHYWAANNFAPRIPHLPPYLTFFGGGNFGYVASREQLRDEVLGGETEAKIVEIAEKKRTLAKQLQEQQREQQRAEKQLRQQQKQQGRIDIREQGPSEEMQAQSKIEVTSDITSASNASSTASEENRM